MTTKSSTSPLTRAPLGSFVDYRTNPKIQANTVFFPEDMLKSETELKIQNFNILTIQKVIKKLLMSKRTVQRVVDKSFDRYPTIAWTYAENPVFDDLLPYAEKLNEFRDLNQLAKTVGIRWDILIRMGLFYTGSSLRVLRDSKAVSFKI